MFRLQALNRMNSTALAVLCGEIATHHPDLALGNETKTIGFRLMREWNQLQPPPIGTPQHTPLLQTRRNAVRQRMIDFLISI